MRLKTFYHFRSKYRVLITGLPPSGSWQDLKDHMRDAGDVCFADVFKDGSGAVEYTRFQLIYLLTRVLDPSYFRGGFGSLVNGSSKDILQ
jgi:arginine/serine-rich splicing factor 1/9